MKTSMILAGSLAILGFAISTTASSQDLPKGVLGSGTQESTSGLSSQGMELLVGSDSSAISATFRLDQDKGDHLKVGKDYLRLKLTAPLDKSTMGGNFFTSTGLSNDFAAKLSWSRISVDVPFKNRIHDASDTASTLFIARCNQRFANATEISVTPDNQQRICGDALQAGSTMMLNGKPIPGAFVKMLTELEQQIVNEKLGFITDLAIQPIWYYGVEVGVGYEKHSFRDPVDSTKLNQEKVSYAVSSYIGVTPTTEKLYLGGGLIHKISYKDADEMTRCGSTDENGFQDCITASYASPAKETDSSIFVLARYEPKIIQNTRNRAFGLEVKAAYDFEDNKFAIGAPLYLFQDKDKKLSGGVRLDWDNKSNDVTAGVFVGSSFSLLGSN